MENEIKTTAYRVEPSLRECLMRYAKDKGCVQTRIVEIALRKYLNEHGYYENEANEKSTA